MREKELMDRSWVPMPGVPWRVVVRVHPARVPDVVRVHALCSRLHRPTLVARPSRLSIVSRVWILYAGAVGVSIGSWAHDKARALLDLGDLADIDTGAT